MSARCRSCPRRTSASCSVRTWIPPLSSCIGGGSARWCGCGKPTPRTRPPTGWGAPGTPTGWPRRCAHATERFPSGAVAADVLAVALLGQPAPVMHQEALRARELVGLLGHDANRQVLTGQAGEVCAGQLEALRCFGLVDVDDPGLVLVAARLEFLERVLGEVVGLATAWRVVIGGHGLAPPLPNVCAAGQRSGAPVCA